MTLTPPSFPSNMDIALHLASHVKLLENCPLAAICHEYFTLQQALENIGIDAKFAECSVSSKIKGASHDHHVSVFYPLVDGELLSFMGQDDQRDPAVIGKERLFPSITQMHSHLLGPNPTIESVECRVNTHIYTDGAEDRKIIDKRQNKLEVARLEAIALDLFTAKSSGVYQKARL